MTYRLVANNILEMLKQKFDDRDITLIQIIYLIQVVSNQLRRQYMSEVMSGLFLSTFDSVSVKIDSSNKNRKYFDLPRTIMDLPQSKGIEYITYNYDTGCCCDGPNWAQTFFQPTRPGEAFRLYGDPHEKPAPDNPYFYQVGHELDGAKINRIYLLGVECVDIQNVEIAIYNVLDPKLICSLDDEIPIPDSLINALNKEVLELARFEFLMPKERINEGADMSRPQATVPAPPPEQTNEQ